MGNQRRRASPFDVLWRLRGRISTEGRVRLASSKCIELSGGAWVEEAEP